MFTDVADFTALTECADPESVMLYTSRYFAVLSDAIMSNKGTVDKFMGDALMALWNAPVEDPDHVGNARAAILACQHAIHELNERFEREKWSVYRTRYGLHVGSVVAGNIGSADWMNYTVLGPSVNLATRLESLNNVYGTAALVSGQIKRRAEARFLFRSVDRISPKGFAEKFPVFELRCRRESADQSERTFCQAWEEVYGALSAADPEASRQRLCRFLATYPDDSVARYHAENMRRQAGERSEADGGP